jgi:hypothetical protein
MQENIFQSQEEYQKKKAQLIKLQKIFTSSKLSEGLLNKCLLIE